MTILMKLLKRPVFWISLLGISTLAILTIAVLTNPHTTRSTLVWARNLSEKDISSIELVVMPSHPNLQYKKLNQAENNEALSIIHKSLGRYEKNPKIIDGDCITYYITLVDGSIHTVQNYGDYYLVIDGEYFKSNFSWLSKWKHSEGDSPLPPSFIKHHKIDQLYSISAIETNSRNIITEKAVVDSTATALLQNTLSNLHEDYNAVNLSLLKDDVIYTIESPIANVTSEKYYIYMLDNYAMVQKSNSKYSSRLNKNLYFRLVYMLFPDPYITELIDKLSAYPQDYRPGLAVPDGKFVIRDNQVLSTMYLFDDFIHHTNEGYPDEITFVHYTSNSMAILDHITYDGEKFTYIHDLSRNSNCMYTSYTASVYQYIKIFDVSNKRYIYLTNNKDLTLEQAQKGAENQLDVSYIVEFNL